MPNKLPDYLLISALSRPSGDIMRVLINVAMIEAIEFDKQTVSNRVATVARIRMNRTLSRAITPPGKPASNVETGITYVVVENEAVRLQAIFAPDNEIIADLQTWAAFPRPVATAPAPPPPPPPAPAPRPYVLPDASVTSVLDLPNPDPDAPPMPPAPRPMMPAANALRPIPTQRPGGVPKTPKPDFNLVRQRLEEARLGEE